MIELDPVEAFLTPAHRETAAKLDAYLQRVIEPLPAPSDDDEARVQAREILDLLGGGDWYRSILEQDYRALCVVREAVAARSPLADAVVALQGLSMTPLMLADNQQMREAWLEPAARGSAMGAFAMTEPEAGSDVGSMSTRATREGDLYVLDGRKTLISNAGIADFYVLFARTGEVDDGHRGLSCFVVPAATEGLQFEAPQVLSAPHPLGEISLDGCRVPAAFRLGDEGAGFKLGLATLDCLRPTVGAAACGMAARALREALDHTSERRQFGQPLAEFQLVQGRLARMATDLAAARLLVYRAAAAKDAGKERITLEAAMAKSFATEAAQRIVDDAVQLLGGRGVLAEHPVDRLYRSVRALRIYEGTTEIQQLLIARQLLKQHQSD